ncbi:MAG: 4Fe-4S dicluster domain-containing protein [archaeon]|nr:4Fe-4S dicluster domain-containing protein [archaeon]
MFPKVSKIKENDISKIKVQYLKDSVGMHIDEGACQGCGICIKVCPTNALSRGPVGGAKKRVMEDLIPTEINAITCSFCGLCAYMCPWNVVTLIKNNEEISLDELDIVARNAVPQLDYKMTKCKEGVKDAKVYLEGDIEFKSENCVGGCDTCVDICPTGAISIEKADTPWDKGRKLVVDKDKCILCGTCTNACPVFNVIKISITDVKSKGKSNAIFWDKIVEQLKISRMRDGKKIN